MALGSNASRSVRAGQDITTHRGTEHVSTEWGVRREGSSVCYLQSQVQWLTNETVDVHTQHILQQQCNGRELLEKLNLHSQQSMSVAHIVEFNGDHKNSKLHKNLEECHMRELNHLIVSEIDLATQITCSALSMPTAFLRKGQLLLLSRHAGNRARESWCFFQKIWPQAEERMHL